MSVTRPTLSDEAALGFDPLALLIAPNAASARAAATPDSHSARRRILELMRLLPSRKKANLTHAKAGSRTRGTHNGRLTQQSPPTAAWQAAAADAPASSARAIPLISRGCARNCWNSRHM